MTFLQAIQEFAMQRLSMLAFCQILDCLGYTRQERRRIVTGIIRYRLTCVTLDK